MTLWPRIFSGLARFQVSFTFAVLCAVVYSLEYFFGIARNLVKLYSYGAFSPEAVFSFNQWWRVVLSPFMHYDITHLVSALVIILSIGFLCERRLGPFAMLALYFLGSVVPMCFVGIVYSLGLPNDTMLFGASYPALALLGFVMRSFLIGRGHRLSAISWRKIGVTTLLVAAAWYCWHRYLPVISFQGHSAAFLTGYLLFPLIFKHGGKSAAPTGRRPHAPRKDFAKAA